jgi:predicted small lipoprotein YifL
VRSIVAIALVALIAVAGLAGCGEKPNVTVYKQGKYQGKPDNVPWQGAPFNNNQAEWEKAIRARNNGQNEYLRTGS